MKKETFKLTEEGKKKLELELDDLISVQRPRNIEAIQEARAQGDLSENADYDAARDEQARIEARVKELEAILKNCEIIKGDSNADSVEVGKTVTIKFVKTGLVNKFTIVCTIEANPFENKISDASPLCAELTRTVTGENGKPQPKYNKGDSVTYVTEAGKTVEIEILDVFFE